VEQMFSYQRVLRVVVREDFCDQPRDVAAKGSSLCLPPCLLLRDRTL
jgi:hypothetical protein